MGLLDPPLWNPDTDLPGLYILLIEVSPKGKPRPLTSTAEERGVEQNEPNFLSRTGDQEDTAFISSSQKVTESSLR